MVRSRNVDTYNQLASLRSEYLLASLNTQLMGHFDQLCSAIAARWFVTREGTARCAIVPCAFAAFVWGCLLPWLAQGHELEEVGRQIETAPAYDVLQPPPTAPDMIEEPTSPGPVTQVPRRPAARTNSRRDLFSTLGRGLVARDTMVGYIDTAIPMDQLRFRYEAGYGVDRASRAEFFWPGRTSPTSPLLGERRVDYQDFSLYYEMAPRQAFSLFAELPLRLLNPDINPNTGGLGDMNAGFKWAFCQTCNAVTTFQWRTYAPTGDAQRGLGTHHASLEPALLHWRRLSDRLTLEAELRDWIAVGGTPGFQGNVLRYGIGLSYVVAQTPCARIAPVCEVVGWTVLDGAQNVPAPPQTIGIEDAAGDTIVNVKAGVRAALGCHRDLYVGYGHALTGDVWYEDVLRFELRHRF